MIKENRTSMVRAADAEDPNCDMDECNTCGAPIDEEQGDIRGYFGILPHQPIPFRTVNSTPSR